MIKVGITGNIGSGKSTVARIFSILGIPIYDADTRAKAVMIENQSLVQSIKELIGEDSYASDGSLNRAIISQKVFSNSTLLQGLNALVHPAVFKDFDDWVLRQDSPYVLKEAALLIESGSYKTLDKLIVVSAPEEIRLKRSIERDASNEAAIRDRMKNQMPEEEKLKMAHFCVQNHEQLLIPQVIKIHQELLKLSLV
ncbi:MAG: dephospho-CoA kinase [Bacteroidetes bacterium B1(2017)]|nr:MAG: dephospho-CoA kinase [Bacteroidetes bacterium B1(2017)]